MGGTAKQKKLEREHCENQPAPKQHYGNVVGGIDDDMHPNTGPHAWIRRRPMLPIHMLFSNNENSVQKALMRFPGCKVTISLGGRVGPNRVGRVIYGGIGP
ncbi:uncharacterized protein LOC106669527 [Cimex lectularius]|uniref:Uncharacterized protein n=1 Tax=Cimex lectularius TaxID=79782 RepID=A0A8I6SPT2_CIMLE|nr:uncharacterized protein LOC106669527 [Cimex lectularius]